MSGLVRDFSLATQDAIKYLLEDNYDNNHKHIIDALLKAVNEKKEYHYVDINNNVFTTKIGEYYSKLIDANIISKKEYERLIEKVYDVDQNYCGKAKIVYNQINAFALLINLINSAFVKNENGQYLIELNKFTTETLKSIELHIDLFNEKCKYGLNPAFDQHGMYGGNQSQASRKFVVGSSEFNQMAAIARKYDKYSEYSDAEIDQLIDTAAKTGCAYIAMVNTVFDRFVGREDEFEEAFGYPMYMNGDLNYSSVFLDFYCYSDLERGIHREERETRWENFCAERNIDVEVQNQPFMDKETFDSYRGKDIHVNIQTGKFNLLDMEGRTVYRNVGYHAMCVTDITDDGRVMVSSWGSQYYIDPDNFGENVLYQIVEYN